MVKAIEVGLNFQITRNISSNKNSFINLSDRLITPCNENYMLQKIGCNGVSKHHAQ